MPPLPGVVDSHEPRALGIARGRQVAVPREQARVVGAQEAPRALDPLRFLAAGGLPDTPDGYGVYRRLAQATRVGARGRPGERAEEFQRSASGK